MDRSLDVANLSGAYIQYCREFSVAVGVILYYSISDGLLRPIAMLSQIADVLPRTLHSVSTAATSTVTDYKSV
jgi:hypothetical protein